MASWLVGANPESWRGRQPWPRRAGFGWLPALLVFVCACRFTDLQVRDLNAVPKVEGIVFGEIKVRGGFDSVALISRKTGRPVALEVKARGGGSFCWHLPPGRYAVAEVRTSEQRDVLVLTHFISLPPSPGYRSLYDSGGGYDALLPGKETISRGARTYATFDVPLPGEPPRYIGTLVVEKTRWGVDDRFAQVAERLRRELPGVGECSKQLMQPEDER